MLREHLWSSEQCLGTSRLLTQLMPGHKVGVGGTRVVGSGHIWEEGGRIVGEGHVVGVKDAQSRLVLAVREP